MRAGLTVISTRVRTKVRDHDYIWAILAKLVAEDRPVAEPASYARRRTSVSLDWRRLIGLAGVGVLGVGVTVVTVAGCAPARKVANATAVRKTITIDPQVGETFAPAPASARPRLTAQLAWARYMRQLGYPHRTALPSVIRVRLGLLTLPTGPGGTGPYTARDYLTYGYSTPSACVTMNPRVLLPRDARCIRWEFLDANTGAEIEGTLQPVRHWQPLTDFNAMVPGLRFALTINGQLVAYPDGTAPSYPVHRGERLLMTVVVTVPRHLRLTKLWLGISRHNWSGGPNVRSAGVHPILVHCAPLSAGAHAFDLRWRVPEHLSVTSFFVVIDWSSRSPPAGLGAAIAELPVN